MKSYLMVLVLAAVGSGCAFTPVAYNAKAASVEDPAAEIKSIVMANTPPNCLMNVDVSDRFMVFKTLCGGGARTDTVRLTSMETIELGTWGSFAAVRVHHSSGAADFSWATKNPSDAERVVDLLTTIKSRQQPQAAKKVEAGI